MKKLSLTFIFSLFYFVFGASDLQAREIYAPDATVRTATTIENQLGFNCSYHDEESDLVYKRARYYSIDKGEFIGRDPAGYIDGQSLYTAYFAAGFKTDPTGKWTVVCIHSNAAADVGSPGLSAGHAFVSLHQGGGFLGTSSTTYGLWPDDHDSVVDNGDSSDVRTNASGDNMHTYQYRRCKCIDIDGFMKFYQFTSIDHHTWGYLNSCASFASDAYALATGEDVDADDNFGIETPREIGEHIRDLNGGKDWNNPLPCDKGGKAEDPSIFGFIKDSSNATSGSSKCDKDETPDNSEEKPDQLPGRGTGTEVETEINS